MNPLLTSLNVLALVLSSGFGIQMVANTNDMSLPAAALSMAGAGAALLLASPYLLALWVTHGARQKWIVAAAFLANAFVLLQWLGFVLLAFGASRQFGGFVSLLALPVLLVNGFNLRSISGQFRAITAARRQAPSDHDDP